MPGCRPQRGFTLLVAPARPVEVLQALQGLIQPIDTLLLYCPVPGSTDIRGVRFRSAQGGRLCRASEFRIPPVEGDGVVGAVPTTDRLLGDRGVLTVLSPANGGAIRSLVDVGVHHWRCWSRSSGVRLGYTAE